VAIFHLSAHERVSRSAGQSSIASAAYIMRARFTDERTGQGYDFRRLDAPEWVGMFSPKEAPAWTREAANAERFWNALELFEKRKDAQIALPLDIALPHELTLQQNVWLAQDYIREAFTRQGYVVLAAIHPPDHDERNIHLHLLVSLRRIDAHGFARTKTEQQDNYRNRDAYIENLREKWEQLANRHLERHGIDARIDRRTLQEQGLDHAPERHRGPTKSAVVFLDQDRAARAAAVAEIAQLEAQIINLGVKRSEREARAGQGRERSHADETPKAQDMKTERTNDNDAYLGASEYIDACCAEFERQAEAAKGLPDPFHPPLPQNENERQAFKLWLGELEQQVGGRIDISREAIAASGEPFKPGEHLHLVEHELPPAANQNQRGAPEPMSANPTFGPETIAASDPAAGAQKMHEQAAPQPEPDAAPEWPYTMEEAIRRDPWNAVTLDLPEDTSAQSYSAIAGVAQDLRIGAEARADAATSIEETEYWQDLALKADLRFDDAIVKFYQAAEREGIDLMKQAPKIAPEAAGTQELPPAPEEPEPATSSVGVPQREEQAQSTVDYIPATAPSRPEASTISHLVDGLADRLGGLITYLSDLIAPPPAIPPEQLTDTVQRANEADQFAAYRQNHIPGYDPTDHQDSETRKISERDHDRGRGIDLEPD